MFYFAGPWKIIVRCLKIYAGRLKVGLSSQHRIGPLECNKWDAQKSTQRNSNSDWAPSYPLLHFVGPRNIIVGCLKICAGRLNLGLSSQHRTIILCGPSNYYSEMLKNLRTETQTQIELPTSHCRSIYESPHRWIMLWRALGPRNRSPLWPTSLDSTVCITPNNKHFDKKKQRLLHLLLYSVALTIWIHMQCYNYLLCTSFYVNKDHIGCLDTIEHQTW